MTHVYSDSMCVSVYCTLGDLTVKLSMSIVICLQVIVGTECLER